MENLHFRVQDIYPLKNELEWVLGPYFCKL